MHVCIIGIFVKSNEGKICILKLAPSAPREMD